MMPYTNVHWHKFFVGVGHSDLASDVRFASMSARTEHIEALYKLTGEIVSQHNTAHWLALCERLEIPAARMNTLADLKTDPHLQATDFFAALDDPAMGALRFPGVPVLFDGERPPVNGVPRLGEHTHAVFAQTGVPTDTFTAWVASGTVQAAKTPTT
jgi:crotonobetainyl-CoA:carnitine CoA-transferase CaiB-like acyl-CoA transferase